MSETQAQEQKITLTLTPEEVKEEQQTQLQNLEEEKQEEPKKGKTLEEMYQILSRTSICCRGWFRN